MMADTVSSTSVVLPMSDLVLHLGDQGEFADHARCPGDPFAFWKRTNDFAVRIRRVSQDHS